MESLIGPPSEMLLGLAIDLVAIAALVGLGYRPLRRGEEMTFMLTTINVVVFGIAYAMLHVSLGVGAAFGLFALFGILRFRTGTLDVTEMSFLFAALALAVVNASGLSGLTLTELLLINGLTLLALIGGARVSFGNVVEYGETKVVYDRADILAGHNPARVVADLRKRTGLDVRAVSIVSVDLTSNTATLRLYHTEPRPSADFSIPRDRYYPDDQIPVGNGNGSNGDGQANGKSPIFLDEADDTFYRPRH